MCISSIQGLYRFIKLNSGFSGHTVHSVINALGFQLQQPASQLKELSRLLRTCSKYGADLRFPGFFSYDDTNKFFLRHRPDIVSHMEKYAAESGTDILTMVQNFRIFGAYIHKPTLCEIGKALWDSRHYWPEYRHIYNIFSWYTLERISQTWNRYLVAHPDYANKLSA